jgi:hypothetical protein
MFGLLIFGPLLEQFLGPKKLLILWMVCGVGSGVLYSGYNSYRMNDLQDKVEAFENDPNPEAFNKLVIANRGFFQSSVFDFVDDYSRNPNDPNRISQAKQTLNAIMEIQGKKQELGEVYEKYNTTLIK